MTGVKLNTSTRTQTSRLLKLDSWHLWSYDTCRIEHHKKPFNWTYCSGYRDKNMLLCLTEITLGQRLVKAWSRVAKYLLLTTHINSLLHWGIQVSWCPYPACELVWHSAPTFYMWQLHNSVAETKRGRERHVDITRPMKHTAIKQIQQTSVISRTRLHFPHNASKYLYSLLIIIKLFWLQLQKEVSAVLESPQKYDVIHVEHPLRCYYGDV